MIENGGTIAHKLSNLGSCGLCLTEGCVCHITRDDPGDSGYQVQAVHLVGHPGSQLRIPASEVSRHPAVRLCLQPGNGLLHWLHRPVLRLLAKALHSSIDT